MPTAVYDASRVTQKQRSIALYTFNRLNSAAVNAGNSVRREQPTTQLNEILIYRQQTVAYTNPTADCPCSEEVVKNSGGGNCNNVE